MDVTTIGIDLAKEVFHVYGVDKKGRKVVKRRIYRAELRKWANELPKNCTIGMEACGSANYWARQFQAMGQEVKLMAPQFVKPYVKTNKNDFNDAEAICEAMGRPTMRFVSIKQVAQQDIQALHRIRSGFIAERTAIVNRVRGLLAEYGIVISRNVGQLRKKLPIILEDSSNELTVLTRELFRDLYEEIKHIDERIKKYDQKIEVLFKEDEQCKKIGAIEGVGPITATAMVATLSDPKVFKNGRQFSAFLGLVPRQHSSGGKNTLLGISKRGDSYLRTLLIHGARSVVLRAPFKEDKRSLWITKKQKERGTNKACVAVANKNARIIWALLAKDENYKKAA